MMKNRNLPTQYFLGVVAQFGRIGVKIWEPGRSAVRPADVVRVREISPDVVHVQFDNFEVVDFASTFADFLKTLPVGISTDSIVARLAVRNMTVACRSAR